MSESSADLLDRALKVYNSLVESPSLISATSFGPADEPCLDLLYSNISIATSSITTSREVLSINSKSTSQTAVATPLDPSIKHVAHSPDGTREAHFVEHADKGRFVQIWDNGCKAGDVEVGDKHGEWFFDPVIGIPTFSTDLSTLIYVANPAPSQVPSTDYVPSFGEGYRALTTPTIISLDLSSLSIRTLLSSPITIEDKEVFFLGASIASMTKNTVALVGEGWQRLADGSQLGMAWCTNRPSIVCSVTVDLASGKTQATRISEAGRSARSPRISPSGTLVYLSNPLNGPHDSCAKLHAYDTASKTNRVTVDTVASPADGAFPGIYAHMLPHNPWLTLNGQEVVVLTSAWGCRNTVLLIDVQSGVVTDLAERLPKNANTHSQATLEVICTYGSTGLLVSASTPVSVPALLAVDLGSSVQPVTVDIVRKSRTPPKAAEHLADLDFKIVPIASYHPLEMLITAPRHVLTDKKSSAPIILLPHGGAICGYVVVQPNYYGSTGYGQDFIDRLLPPALSVKEVETTLAAVPELEKLGLDWRPGKRFLVGSSHGGYIGAWVNGRHSGMTDAMVLINPTIHYPAMIHSTDIPDVITSSSGVPYAYDNPPITHTPEAYARHYACSPISVVDKARTPTLLLIGAEDGRVSPEQGRLWYHGLKKNGVEAGMKIYKDDRHGLNLTVPAVTGVFSEGVQWLMKFTTWDQ